jgi:hypothetical protein
MCIFWTALQTLLSHVCLIASKRDKKDGVIRTLLEMLRNGIQYIAAAVVHV